LDHVETCQGTDVFLDIYTQGIANNKKGNLETKFSFLANYMQTVGKSCLNY